MVLSVSRLAMVCCLIGSLTEVLSELCAQGLQDVVPPFQLNGFRYIVQLLLSICIVCLQKKDFKVPREQVMYVIAAIVTSVAYNTAYYTAASHLPLGLLVTLKVLTQIIAALVVQKFVQYHIIHMLKLPGCCVVVLGSALMLQPLLALEVHEVFEKRTVIGVILVVIAGVWGVLTAYVVQNYTPPAALMLWSLWVTAGGALASTVLAFYTDNIQVTLTSRQALLLCGHCLGAAITGVMECIAFKYISLVTFAVLKNFKLVLNFLLQYSVMHSVVKVAANATEIIGVVITMIGIVYTAGFDIYTEKTQVFQKEGK